MIDYEGQVTAANEKIDHEKNNVIELKVDGYAYKILLPNRSTDYIQQKISKEKLPYELKMLQDIRKKVSSTDLVLDIGANIGNHSLYLACVTKCHVVAFEPNRALADAICASADMNGLAHRVSVHAIGIGSQRAHGHFTKEIPNNLGSQSIELGDGAIQILSLDSMSFDQPVKVMKIDVEGMEMAVLQGAKMLLRKDRPILYVECPSENEFRDIHSWLVPMDYCYWDTFNATPTHLFLPNEQVVLDQHFSRLHSKIALNSYRESQQLVTVKSQLNDARIKYRDVTEQFATLKTRLDEANQKHIKLSRLLDDLHKQNKRIQESITALRASISFRIGYALVSAARSWRGFIKLPASLWGISKQILRNVRKQATGDVAGRISSQKVGKYLATKNHVMEQERQPDQPDAWPILRSHKVPPIVDLLQRDMASTLKVACIMDEFTFNAFQPECSLMQLTPSNWKTELEAFQPELLFIESAWRGKDELWKKKISHKSEDMQGIVDWCREYEVPTVFWNKEDPIHFQTFLNTANLFDYVFTTDLDCIHRYKAALGHGRIYLLPFACQPAVHNPIEKYQRKDAISFAGAYYVRYPERTRDLENFLKALPDFRPVEIFDRNFGKDDPNYQFPPEYRSYIVGTLPFDKIDLAYKGYQYAINLNSIKQSQTMFARRVFELLGSNTITISNYSRGLRLMMGDLVIASDDGDQILHSLRALADDPDRAGKLKIAALRKVMLEHTYGQRLTYIRAKVSGMDMPEDDLLEIAVLAQANSQAEVDRLTAQFMAQTHRRKSLFLLAASNVQLNATGNIYHLSPEHISGKKIGDVACDAAWTVCMSSQDYYGPNYLLDIAIATRYTEATLIGKAAHFQAHGQNSIQLMQAQDAYKPAGGFPVRCSAVRTNLVANENLPQWLDEISDRRLECDQAFAIDSYNYCLNASPDLIAAIKDRVNDLPGLDMGLNIHQLQKMAEQIPPATISNNENVLGPDWLAILFGKCRPKNIKVTITDKALVLRSHLKNGQHEYLYADEDVLADVLAKNNTLKCFLNTTPGLAVSLVALFLDAYKQRISHGIYQANRNATADIPTEAAYIRLGLRVYAGGEGEIKGLVIGHRDMQPSRVLGKAKYLLLTNHYPSYDDLYRNGFVHSRVRAYKELGVNVDVFRLRKGEPISWHEFQNVDVITGSQEALSSLLTSGRYKNVLVHFLSAEMWEVLRKFADRIMMTVWLHGAEIHPWYRRKFNLGREDQIEKAKLQSEKRLNFWRDLLNPIPKNFQLVFVSNSLSREVMEDLGFELPKSHYQIIHNPINTDLFKYQKKDPRQRRRILSIRPYASNQYANDLSVETILFLSKKPFFNELEFRLIGDGKLFEKTLAPLKGMENVIIERCFLTQQKIAQIHKKYGLFLCPTRWDSQGVSRDEAMASGLVPITNAVAAIPEFVDSSCGILSPVEDARALAEGIITLYENPALFETMSAAAAQNVRRNRELDKVIEREMALFVSTIQ